MKVIPAVFLDRDGTVIRDTNYVAHPGEVALLPGAAEAIARLNAAGVPVVIVTNQSGIARGLLTEEDYVRVNSRMGDLLSAYGATVRAAYHCPHAPGAGGNPMCDCRKPGTALFRRAAREHGLDLTRSFYAGDKWRDVAPALVLGGTGVLVPSDATTEEDRLRAVADARIASSIGEVADLALAAR